MHGLDLKVMRIIRGWTQWDLAIRAGLHPARVSEMERGRRKVSEAVVDALGPGPFVTLGATSKEVTD